MVYHNFLHLPHVISLKDSPGLGLRALQAMSSASITIMWLCEYESKKTVIIVKWKLIYTNHQRQYHNTIFQAYCQDVWKKLSCYS